MTEDTDEAGNGSAQFPSLSRAMDRSKTTKDPFAEDSKPEATGQMRARAFARIRTALLEGNEGAGERVPGTTVPVVKFQRFIAALEKQAGARDSKIGRQAGRVLTFLRKDLQQGADAVSGVNIAQFRKLVRMVERQTAEGGAAVTPRRAQAGARRRQPK